MAGHLFCHLRPDPMKKFLFVAFVIPALLFSVSCGTIKGVASKRYYEEGKQKFAAKKYKEASLAFRKAIQKDQQFGDAYYQYALSELEQGGDATNALGALKIAMSLMPEKEDIKVKLAGLFILGYLQQGAIEQYPLKEAKDISQSLLQKNPKSVEGLRLSGHIAIMEKDFPKAVEFFNKALQLKPDSAETLAGLGEAYARGGKAKEAEPILLKTVAIEPRFSVVYDLLYLIYLDERRFADAEAILRQRVEKNPGDPGARAALAAHMFRLQKPKEMEAALAPLIEDAKTYPQGKLVAGDFYRSIGNIGEARRNYEAGLKAASGEKDTANTYRKRLANLLLLEGKRDEAEKAYSDVIQDSPKDPESRARRALLTMQKDAGAALKEFQALAKETPNNPLIRYNLGLAYLATRQMEEARTSFLEASRAQRNFLEPRLALAQMALDTERFREVQQYANEILTVNERHPEARYFRCAALTGLGNFQESRKGLESLIKEFPNYREAQLQMAFVDLAERKYSQADARLRELYKTTKDVRALTGLTEVLLAQNQQKEARALAQEELNKNPEDARVRLLLARTALRTGDYPLAIREYIRLAERDQNWDYLYLQLGQAHQFNGDLPRAILAYQRAIQVSPKSLEAVLRLAYAYEVSGQPKEAMAAYRRALALNANTPIAMNNLAYLLSENGGDLEEALKLAQLALQRVPQQKYIADTVGWIFLKKNEVESAIQIFNGLVKKYPEEAAFRYHLGAGLLRKGDRMKAKAELQAALERKPPEDMEKKIRALMAQIG